MGNKPALSSLSSGASPEFKGSLILDHTDGVGKILHPLPESPGLVGFIKEPHIFAF